jgi:hypothetical protein
VIRPVVVIASQSVQAKQSIMGRDVRVVDRLRRLNGVPRNDSIFIVLVSLLLCLPLSLFADPGSPVASPSTTPTTPTMPNAPSPSSNSSTSAPAAAKPVDDIVQEIRGKFKGRIMVKKILAPVTMNLEKLQDFPEDPSQKILLEQLPFSQGQEFNYRTEVKGHLPFFPWIPAIAEPPFLRMTPPTLANKPMAWIFEVLNPQGQTIFRQRGTNTMPDELTWEGKDSEKKFAVVDRLYSAQLTLIGADEKATIIQGGSIVLSAMIYGSDESETIEFSLNNLFVKDREEISPEGIVMLAKISERMRERGLTKIHIRVSSSSADLAERREKALASAVEKSLILSPTQVEHDHTDASLRGEIAAFWIKKGAS